MCYNKAAVYNRSALGFLTTCVSKARQRCLKGNNLKPPVLHPQAVLLPLPPLLRGGQRVGERGHHGSMPEPSTLSLGRSHFYLHSLVGYSGNIYTMEVGRYCKLGICFSHWKTGG